MLVSSMASFAPLVAALVLTLAEPGAGEPTSTTGLTAPVPVEPIVGGEQTGELEYGSIVAILTSQSGLCTGTVVTPRLILTAAHCVATLPDLGGVVVYYGNGLHADMSVDAVGYGAHPEFDPEGREDIYDYGYVQLGTDFSPPGGFVLPITDQDEWDEAIREQAAVTLVGFGKDPDAVDPLNSLGVKRKVDTTITRFSADGLEFFAGGDGHDSCEGDSGGPALVRLANGTVRLAGITSRGSDPCGEGGFYGTPFPSLAWIRDETGVDLLPVDCNDGDCLDMSPPAKDEGRCAVASPDRNAPPSWAALLLLLGIARRRRRSLVL